MVWYKQGLDRKLDWNHWVVLQHTWPDSAVFHDNFVELHVPIHPGTEMYIASNPVLCYSQFMEWIDVMKEKHGDRLEIGSIGKSVEGRNIPVLGIKGNKEGLPRIFVMAAQHPSEHGGAWASQGIVEYALSAIQEAKEIRSHFELAVIPMINPDGNMNGLSGGNAEGINMFDDFGGVSEGEQPKAKEDQLLWQWFNSEFTPDVILHFHGYIGLKGGTDVPGDGCYLFKNPKSVYDDPDRLCAYMAIQDRLMFETPAYSSCSSWWLGSNTLDYQLARKFGTLSAFYEINTSTVGHYEQFQRGPQVIKAIANALIRDVKIPERSSD